MQYPFSLSETLDALPAQVFSLTPGLTYIAANAAHTSYIDRAPADISGKHVADVIHGAANSGITELCLRALAGGEKTSGMVHMSDRTARPAAFVLTVSPVFGEDNTTTGLICHAIEVGPGGMPESASLAAVEPNAPGLSKADILSRNDRVDLPDIFDKFSIPTFKYILNTIPYGIVIIDMNKRIRFINRMALELSGYRTDDDLLGRICHRILCPTEMDQCPILDFGMSFDRTERKLLTESGIEIPVLKTGLRINIGGEDLLLETFIDLRNTQELAAAYQRSEERYQTIFENTGSGMLIFDEKGTILLANEEMRAITGRDGAYYLAGPSIFSLMAAEDRDRLQEEHKRRTSSPNRIKTSEKTEFRILSADGSTRNIHATVGVIPGTTISVAALNDITDLRKIEAALMLANRKLTTLTRITRHDISNQLTALMLILDIIRGQLDEPIGITGEEDLVGRAISVVESIQSQADFASEYETLGVKKPVWTPVCQTIAKIATEPLFAGIRFSCTISPALSLFCDAMIAKVFYNLFENALRHGGGVTEITLSFVETAAGGILFIRDNGKGIPDEEKPRIFEEEYGKNTGLGLFMIRSILDITGFSIEETGVCSEGATFAITIPKENYRFAHEGPSRKII